MTDLLASEAAGGITLSLAVVVAVAWATLSPSGYAAVTEHPIHAPGLPPSQVHDLASLVTNGLMLVFFAGIGLEIGRERSVGALRDRATAALPVIAAVGGMIGAALVYLLVAATAGPAGAAAGWGVPMATDIAFTLGALSLIPGRASLSLRIFLLALAVADDVLSVIVLALVGHHPPAHGSAASALLALGVVLALGIGLALRRRRAPWPAWVALCLASWWLLAQLGIEPTLAGVAIGVMVPQSGDGTSPGVQLERAVVPASTYLVLPLFALMAAGIDLSTLELGRSAGLVLAIVAARSLGKLLGIGAAVAIAVRLGLGSLPAETNPRQMAGAALTCGIGFTVPILFAEAAFGRSSALLATTKASLLLASLLCAAAGLATIAAQGGGTRGRLASRSTQIEEAP